MKGVATYVNPAFEQTFGFSRHELLGKQIDMEMYRFAALFRHNPAQVLTRPITMGFIALIIVTILFQIRRTIKDRKRGEIDP